MSVSRDWQKKTSDTVQSATPATDAKELERFHALPLIPTLVLRVWIVCVHRYAFLVDYVARYQETGLNRVLAALRVAAVFLLLGFPFLARLQSATVWSTVLTFAEVALLLFPGFTRAPRRLVVLGSFILSLLLTLTDTHVLGASSAALWLPYITLISYSLIMWSLLTLRLDEALNSGSDVQQPIFFDPNILPARSIRVVGWVAAAISQASSTTYLSTLVLLFAFAVWKARMPRVFQMCLSVAPVAAIAAVLMLGIHQTFSLVLLLKVTIFLCGFLVAISAYRNQWFNGNVFIQAKDFRVLFKVSLLLIAVTSVLQVKQLF